MRIAENIEMLKLGGELPIYLTLAWDESNFVLIDTGMPDQTKDIERAVSELGYFFGRCAKDLTHIIITHQDMDHIGCVKDLLKIAPNAKILAHADEAPYMDGSKIPVKLAAALEEYDNETEEEKGYIDEFKQDYEELYFKTDQELKDGDVLPICGGIEIVHTPGHTPGHICLYFQKSKIMVLGDAASVENGELVSFNPIYIHNIDLANQSIEKLKTYDTKGVVGYHSGYFPM